LFLARTARFAWECHQWFLSRQCWKYYPQLGNVINVEGDSIKSVTDVDFDEVDGRQEVGE
jgi:hypothetical protein